MNAEVKAKWVAALRSGKYKQGKHRLRTGSEFCCLGVLCDIHRREVGGKRWVTNLPCAGYKSYDGGLNVLPDSVVKWAGLPPAQPNPVISRNSTLASENDDGKTFLEIADLIEKHL